ncbi:response regulator [Ferruginibacter yonginensis]|uniref:Response regulator n=1 Tax=Ferruginibacter yonginensis TaxID=1310416 RepID=A0ABV8QU35_9BACT
MKPIHILLVEDNEGDIVLTTEAFESAKIMNQLSIVKDGKEAIDFLTKQGNYTNASLPDLMLLDVNLPKKNGHEVLQFIKTNDDLKQLPVVMLTTSSSENDVLKAYKNYVNCYITKPVEIDMFMDVISKIENFWISIVHLPKTKNTTND